jgi:hypothetical protein
MNNEPIILMLYVDDLFLTGEEKLITECKKRLASKFEMKDLVLMHYFLGLEVWQSPERIFLNQELHKNDKESCIPQQVEAHRDQLSLHPRHGIERSLEALVH